MALEMWTSLLQSSQCKSAALLRLIPASSAVMSDWCNHFVKSKDAQFDLVIAGSSWCVIRLLTWLVLYKVCSMLPTGDLGIVHKVYILVKYYPEDTFLTNNVF